MSKLFSEETLSHYGIPGMKHGVRRWQYEDGRFNEEGKIRYFGKKDQKDGLTPEERNIYIQELNDYQLEQRYNQMIKEKKNPKLTNVKKVVTTIMKNTIVDSILFSTLLWAGKKYLEKNNINLSDVKLINTISDIAKNSKEFKENMNPIFTIFKTKK